jgi:KipI family sensor histidine kinase inhibitor
MSGLVRDAGDAGLLLRLGSTIDLAVNARALGIAEAFRRHRFDGVRDVIATYHSVAVHFDPRTANRDALKAALEATAVTTAPHTGGALIEVPVAYGGEHGPDLDAVAAFAGRSPREVIDIHRASEYRVFMLGFMPGFPYMGTVDARIAAPRRDTPRVRVVEGSVGIAGAQTGIYPFTSPGGWQLIGRTQLQLFDIARPQPAIIVAGDRVRFVESHRGAEDRTARPAIAPAPGRPSITVIRPGLFTTIQDEGRWGHQSSGVPVAGAMDQASIWAANAAVGNDRGAAAFEVTLLGPELRCEQSCVAAIAGADLGANVDGRPMPLGMAVTCAAGSRIGFTGPRRGGRAYLAVQGGVDVPPVLGSRSTHVRSVMGGFDGRPLRAGDLLSVGDGGSSRGPAHVSVGRDSDSSAVGRSGKEPVRLRVMRGPQDEWFGDDAFERLESCDFTVQPDSDRMGFRLKGAVRIPRMSNEEMISDAAFAGAVQIPSSGDPILLMADRPTTGGYPQMAVVISADLPRAGQLVPGDTVRFSFCSWLEARAALAAVTGPAESSGARRPGGGAV